VTCGVYTRFVEKYVTGRKLSIRVNRRVYPIDDNSPLSTDNPEK